MSAQERERLRESGPLEASKLVPANTTEDNPEDVERVMPFDGKITDLIVGWPDGADNLVGVQFRKGQGDILFPYNQEDDYIAANNFTHPFPLNVRAKQGDKFHAIYVNLDTAQSHFVNVIPVAERL